MATKIAVNNLLWHRTDCMIQMSRRTYKYNFLKVLYSTVLYALYSTKYAYSVQNILCTVYTFCSSIYVEVLISALYMYKS